MGINEQMEKLFGADWSQPPDGVARARTNWEQVCCCGHLQRHHPKADGGLFETADGETSLRGETVRVVNAVEGCRGAMPGRGFELESRSMDREAGVLTITYHATCVCREFRPVANVDRPNRLFNQRLLADRPHPIATGLRALRTHLSKRKYAQTDPDWATAELDRRFTWLEEAQRCSISGCKATDDIFPSYVNDRLDSEMRCPKHR